MYIVEQIAWSVAMVSREGLPKVWSSTPINRHRGNVTYIRFADLPNRRKNGQVTTSLSFA
jgi:hypothetical protein